MCKSMHAHKIHVRTSNLVLVVCNFFFLFSRIRHAVVCLIIRASVRQKDETIKVLAKLNIQCLYTQHSSSVMGFILVINYFSVSTGSFLLCFCL